MAFKPDRWKARSLVNQLKRFIKKEKIMTASVTCPATLSGSHPKDPGFAGGC
jgi:hypothetical protein